jgi:sodium/hydrogen exchanger-like protein 6/7
VALLTARVRHAGALLPRLAFDPAAFFTYLLPPIIFNAGLSVEKAHFFRHLDRIMLLGVAGTLLNCTLIAAGVAASVAGIGGFALSLRDVLAIGAVFGATDTVATLQVLDGRAAPVLFSLVLGEGCVNDAMSLVLLRAVEALPPHGASAGAAADVASLAAHFAYLFVCSTALGLVVGLAAAATARLVAHRSGGGGGDDTVPLEVAVVGVMAYCAFLLAEALRLSGILALFAAALAISHYGLRCLSRGARSTTRHAFDTLAFVCEQLIFLYTGVAALDRAAWEVARPGEVLALLGTLGALLLIARALTVLAVMALGNALAGGAAARRMSVREACVVWWAGLMRGAVSVAIATHHFAVAAPGAPRAPPPPPGTPEAEELRTHASVVATSFLLVLISTVIFSGFTRPFLARVLPSAMAGAAAASTAAPACRRRSGGGGASASLSSWDAEAEASAMAHGENEDDDADGGDAPGWLHRVWRAADERFLAPLLGGAGAWEAQEAALSGERGAYTELLNRS